MLVSKLLAHELTHPVIVGVSILGLQTGDYERHVVRWCSGGIESVWMYVFACAEFGEWSYRGGCCSVWIVLWSESGVEGMQYLCK